MNRLPKVLMVVDNSVTGDSRVQKSAMSVAKLGYDVTVLGLGLNGDPNDNLNLPGVKLIRIKSTIELDQKKRFTPPFNPLYIFAFPNRQAVSYSKRRLEIAKMNLEQVSATRNWKSRPQTVYVFTLKAVHYFRGTVFALAIKHGSKAEGSKLAIVRSRLTKKFFIGNSGPRITPLIKDLELQAWPIIQSVDPEIIHAQDFRAIGLATRAVEYRNATGKPTKLLYDAHEFLPGVESLQARVHQGYVIDEANCIGSADLVITVSDDIAAMLVDRHQLKSTPYVVANAPTITKNANFHMDIRSELKIGQDEVLGVYLGGLAKHRGIDAVVDGLRNLPTVHIALVSPINEYGKTLVERIASTEMVNRLHFLPYVDPENIVQYISTADFGIAPYLHMINQENSLPSKFYEYACAGLPIIGSDVRKLSNTIIENEIGEVFQAGNATAFASAVTRLISSENWPFRIQPKAGWSWEDQEIVLAEIYRKLLSTG
jgi:glycogen(starch) synthase